MWLHLRKERFPSKRKSKLSFKVNGSFEIITPVRDNAYKAAIPNEFVRVLATFNVRDLAPYLEDKNLPDLRANPLQLKEDDMDSA